MEGSNTLVTNYPNSGTSEIRAWCHERVAKDWQKFRSTENYNKLSYNTAFPWMADSPDGKVSMNYAVLNDKQEWEVLRLYTFKSLKMEFITEMQNLKQTRKSNSDWQIFRFLTVFCV